MDVDQDADIHAVVVLEFQALQEFLLGRDHPAQRLGIAGQIGEENAQERLGHELRHPAGLAAEGPLGEIAPVPDHRFGQPADDVGLVIADVPVEKDDDLEFRQIQPFPHGIALAQNGAFNHGGAAFFRLGDGLVDRVVVDDDHFPDGLVLLRQPDDLADGFFLVEDGDDDADPFPGKESEPCPKFFKHFVSDAAPPLGRKIPFFS